MLHVPIIYKIKVFNICIISYLQSYKLHTSISIYRLENYITVEYTLFFIDRYLLIIIEYSGYRVTGDLFVNSIELQLQSAIVLNDKVHV